MTASSPDAPHFPDGGPPVEQLEARAYRLPVDADEESDGTATWTATTMVVVRARAAGVTGTGWTYGPAACVGLVDELLAPVVRGRPAFGVPGTWLAMVRAARNSTRAGAVGYAVSAVDVALWDLHARLLGLPAPDLLGRVHDEVAVYGSGGFTSYDGERLAAQLDHWVHGQGIPRVKIKIGRPGGTDHDRDVARMRLARRTVGTDAELFVDANGAYSAKQAVRTLHAAQEAGADVTWFEEPVTSDDLPGLALVRELVDADVTAGEYGTDIGYFEAMCAAGAVDCLQVDATRCGGWTEWLRASAVAAAHHLEVSAHCAPHLHAPVAAATPNVRHLEWFHDHVRFEDMLFEGTLDPAGGTVRPAPDRPGHGLTLDEDAAARLRVAS
ncbi:enolase C-terminal domain-like protein [Phycicoccus ginsengisoli]